MVVKRQQETFAPVTMGHIRSHGCRDLLVYCVSGTVAPEGGANTCAYSSSTSSSASSSALWARRSMRSCRKAGPEEELLEGAPAREK